MSADTSASIEVGSDHLILQPMPTDAAARLPHDRRMVSELLGAALDDGRPLPDIVELMAIAEVRWRREPGRKDS